MTETIITSNKVNHLIDPVLEIWGWEVGAYLFLGGLTAGCMILSALFFLTGKEKLYQNTAYRLPILAPVFISIGMFALFLDLEFKIHVWRFYTAFKITSPMSWGAWILLLVYPLSLMSILATIRTGYPGLHFFLLKRLSLFGEKTTALYGKVVEFCEKRILTISMLTLPVGISLGIYTGVLLSAFNARPFWNNPILGPLFLISGLSTAAAISLLFSNTNDERYTLNKIDIGLVSTEILLIALFIISMATGPAHSVRALHVIMGGELTHLFWIFIIGFGLLLPLFLEVLEMFSKKIPHRLAPLLILAGGLIFRLLIVHAGQINGWVTY
jgi:formate-dependent nitrite reductase membrane component NrfD